MYVCVSVGVLTFVSPNGDDSSSFLTEQATSPQYPYIQVDNHLNGKCMSMEMYIIRDVMRVSWSWSWSCRSNVVSCHCSWSALRVYNIICPIWCLIADEWSELQSNELFATFFSSVSRIFISTIT